ncbi:hypothetical protein QUA71_26620 [Microcoleus sp. MON1_C5]|uniref:hypothetical protein n=1 Tax=Microcoleus sp. MON1_C5 TaxID=2818828 RepID=UPI002FCECE3D
MFIPLVIALSPPVNIAQAEPCKLSVIGYQETNNCPLLKGIFASEEWTIMLSHWEAGAYVFKGINRVNGKKINTMGSEVRGTVDRPQYPFSEERSETLYLVTFQKGDRNTIRLEIFVDTVPVYNQLLHKTSSNDPFFGR